MMMLKSLKVKTLKILKTVLCPVHVECGVLAYFLTTSYSAVKTVYIQVGMVKGLVILVAGQELPEYGRDICQMPKHVKVK